MTTKENTITPHPKNELIGGDIGNEFIIEGDARRPTSIYKAAASLQNTDLNAGGISETLRHV